MARAATRRRVFYGRRRRSRRRSNPGNPTRYRRRSRAASSAATKAKQATVNSIIVAGTAIGYGALERRIDIPHVDALGEAGTLAIPVWLLGHFINNAPLKYAGATLGGIQLYKEATVWFETDEQKKIRIELEKKRDELIKALAKEKQAEARRGAYVAGAEEDLPPDVYDEEAPEGTEFAGG